MRKRTIRGLAEVYQVATANPWSDTAITFNARDEPKFRTARAPAQGYQYGINILRDFRIK